MRSKTMFSAEDANGCNACGSIKIEKDAGELYCKDCGNIVQESKIETQEYSKNRRKNKDESNRRHGGFIDYSDTNEGFTTRIGRNREYREAYNPEQYYRLKKWQFRKKGNIRRFDKGKKQIKRICRNLSLPDYIIEEASRISRKIHEIDEYMKGKKRIVVSAAIIHLVTRESGIPVTVEKLCDVTKEKKRFINNEYRELCRELDKDYVPMRPKDLVPRYVNRLEIEDQTVLAKSLEIADKISNIDEMTGRSRIGIAVLSVYIANNMVAESDDEKISQSYVHEKADITSTSMRRMLTALSENSDIDRKSVIMK